MDNLKEATHSDTSQHQEQGEHSVIFSNIDQFTTKNVSAVG